MEHTDSPKLKHVVSCPVGITNPTDSSCSTYVLDFYRAAPDIATLESMAMSSKSVIVVEPAFNSGTSSYSTTVEIENPFSISARTLQPKGRAGIQAPEGAGLTAELNGCDKAEQSQAVWEFPGFKSTGVFTFDICAVAPDNIHETWYSLKVNVTRHYSTRLRSLAIVGKEMEPAFDPEVQQYTVHIDAKEKEVDLQLKAEDDEAAIKVDADKTTHGSDSIATTVKMHDNEHLEVGEPPQWSRSVSVQLESADGEKTLTYLVHIKQKVSNYSYLMNLSMDNTSCQMNPPKFQHNVTMYSCVFWWTETESPRVIDEEKCPDCTLLIPSAREFPKSHLSLQYQTQLKRVHQSGEVWSRPFLFGESHVVPFQVLSADKFTHTTYHVHLERDAPWWMKTATTRTISAWATTLATCMAIFSASNFVALTRMVRRTASLERHR
ncbi:unnamed protein product [Cladocopium goreaui]|uniref:Cadherin-like beta sandwich domain-containing protein n=1 Tax=Cladocopium goreaui TaxID=2562237 RepID=A0A9P1BNH8_9DINO|nr:unnamed protein product [Cladocopium goreaui]